MMKTLTHLSGYRECPKKSRKSWSCFALFMKAQFLIILKSRVKPDLKSKKYCRFVKMNGFSPNQFAYRTIDFHMNLLGLDSNCMCLRL